MMKISAVMPVLNEIRFVEGWYRNVKKFADEIIVVDTGSTDGTYEFFQSKDVMVYRWPVSYPPYQWPEHEVRNWLLQNASGDWIVLLDADELVGDDFIEELNKLCSAKWLIGRFVFLQFWMDYRYLRQRSLWPPFRTFTNRRGKRQIGLFKNWRGWYPNRVSRICKRDRRINYSSTGNHCVLQYNGLNRLSHHFPWVTKNFDIGFFHSHFVDFERQGKSSGNREYERNSIQRIPLVEYQGTLPNEIRYYNTKQAFAGRVV